MAKGKLSAGLLMYRRAGHLEVLLAHPGGPFWTNKDAGAWTIPKGVVEEGEDDHLATAKREFEEELGAKPNADHYLELGEVRQKAGKTVIAWAFEGDLDPAAIQSNTFKVAWPPRSGRWQDYPEVDRAEFFSIDAAKAKINSAQAEFLSRLETLLGSMSQ